MAGGRRRGGGGRGGRGREGVGAQAGAERVVETGRRGRDVVGGADVAEGVGVGGRRDDAEGLLGGGRRVSLRAWWWRGGLGKSAPFWRFVWVGEAF